MKPCRLPRFRKLPFLPKLALQVSAMGLPVLGWGCAQQAIALVPSEPPALARAVAPDQAEIQVAPQAAPDVLPISLDMVLRMACDQNSQIQLAREKLNEACAQKDLADLAWLPNVYVGAAYWRHEGGIQNEDGTLTRSSTGAIFGGTEINVQLDPKEAAFQRVNACRQVWQRRGELSRITSEQLLEATTTYIDLLMARTSEAIAAQLEKQEQELLKRARDLAEKEPPSRIQAEAIEAELRGHKQAIAKLHQQGDAASVKLAQLIGVDPKTRLMPIDDRLVPFALADTGAPVDDLVDRALANGPGVRELQSLLALVQNSIEKAKGPGMLMPMLELRVAEGGFGAGPGDSMLWDNRFDAALQVRWNLTDLCKARDQQRVTESKLQQLYLSHQELRNKLAAGVREARSAVSGGEEQIRYGADYIRYASHAYQLSDERLKNPPLERADRLTELQVLQSLRALELAHLRYLDAVSAYDKAQLRLLVLTGATSCETPPPATRPAALPVPAAIPQASKPKQ